MESSTLGADYSSSYYDAYISQSLISANACHARVIPVFDGNMEYLWDLISLVDEYFEYMEVESKTKVN